MKIVFVLLSAFCISAHAANGIQALQQVTQQKTEQANDEAVSGADNQRERVAGKKAIQTQTTQQKVLRNTAVPVQHDLRIVKPTDSSQLQRQLLSGLTPADSLQPTLARLGGVLKSMQQMHSKNSKSMSPVSNEKKEALSLLRDLQNTSQQLITGFAAAEKHVIPTGGVQTAKQLKSKIDSMLRDLEAQDKMGNFEIQDLMSQYNQSQNLASSVQKQKDDTTNAIIQNVK